MIGIFDARYVLQEIRNMAYYQQKIADCLQALHDLDELISTATDPASPQGGSDIHVGKQVVRIKVHGNGATAEQRINAYITAQKPLEAELQEWKRKYAKAERYRKDLQGSEDRDFVEAFASGLSYKELSQNYYVTNPYDKAIRLIQRYVTKV